MPIKKSAQKASVPKAEASACCSSVNVFWRALYTIVIGTAIVVLAYIVLIMFQHMLDLSYAVVDLNDRLAPAGQSGMVVPSTQAVQYKETAVSGIWLAYTACPATFTGACDDASLYKLAKDGSKQVVVNSVRAIAGAPRTSELLQPISASPDGNLLVMGAWAFGSNRNTNDNRIWIYDLTKGQIVAKASNVPANAVFSPDYAYAAYAVTDNNDIRDVMIVSFVSDKTVSGAQADDGRTFKNQNGQAELVWKDAKTLVVTMFSIPSGTGASSIPTKTGEKIIKVK